VQAAASGIITEITARPGDIVAVNQIVAHLAQPELDRSIAQGEARLRDLQAQGSESGGLIKGNRELEIAAVDAQRRQIDQAQKDARAQLAYLLERQEAKAEAVRLGLITRDVYQETNKEIARERDTIAGIDAQRTQLDARIAALRNQASQGLFTLDSQIQSEQHQLELLRLQRDRSATVRSPYNGKVLEMVAEDGNLLQAGQPLLALELPDQQLDAYVFVPVSGKRIQPGMSVRVTPAGVSWEEYGYMIGTVRSISEAPLSPAAMTVYLRNPTLVQQFNAQGGAYLVTIDLTEDPATHSGFAWTSRGGPALSIGSGTLLDASITLREQAPITLVIPALRRWLGV
jgi:HlyD family secretion protein